MIGTINVPNMLLTLINNHLPPYLREACSILAMGLVRSGRPAATDFIADLADAAADRESSLPTGAVQSGHGGTRRKITA
jgi:hypothetical protein